MPHPSLPIATIALSFSIGILLRETGIQPSIFVCSVSLVVLVLAHIKRWKRLFWVAAFGSFLFLGTMRHKPPSTNVASTPNQYAIEIKALQNTTAFGHQYLVKTEHKESVLLQTSLENRFLLGNAIWCMEHLFR